MSKAFDKMSHYGLYIKLMELSIPRCFIDILICYGMENALEWYVMITICLRVFMCALVFVRVVFYHLCCFLFL